MDITQAKAILSQVITSRSDEVVALQLAASILDGTYKAEFDSLTNAKAEADQLAGELNTAKADVSSLTMERDTAVQSLSDANTVHETEVADLQAKIATLTPIEVVRSIPASTDVAGVAAP